MPRNFSIPLFWLTLTTLISCSLILQLAPSIQARNLPESSKKKDLSPCSSSNGTYCSANLNSSSPAVLLQHSIKKNLMKDEIVNKKPKDFFPSHPPPGFEKVLPKPIYAELVQIHQNSSMTSEEKRSKIDQIMSKVPDELIDRIPLPPGFDQLPKEKQNAAKVIFREKNIDHKTRDRKLYEFILGLEPKLRKTIFPPIPPHLFIELPFDVQMKVTKLYGDETMGKAQVESKFWELIDGQSVNIKKMFTTTLKNSNNT